MRITAFIGIGFGLISAVVGCSTESGPEAPPEPEPDRPEGALIATRLHSRVGVLLDELPEELRERAAEQVLAASDAFWEQRARAQAALTYYRLAFRDFYYDEEEGRGQLPLPPNELWQIELTGEAERIRVGTHELVVRDYRLTSTLLTNLASAADAEPALGEVGGVWEEPFVLPLDPELLLQRTGYACMDESEYPPNSVDGENTASFFDHECEAGENDCHLTEIPEEDCIEALERAVGTIETGVVFERIAWDDDLADAVRLGEVTFAEQPDVRVLEDALGVQRIVYRYIDENSCALAENCVGGTGWRRLLQFDASVHNVGGAALAIGDVDYYLEGDGTLLADHNIFEYSACHEHYHFSYYGDFSFSAGEQQSGNKQAFCLQSTSRYSNNEHSPLTHPYGSCEFQGIQAGWGDDYGAGIECQWIDVTDVDVSAGDTAGELAFQFNPEAFLCEGTPVLDEAGNPVWEATEFETVHGDPVDRAQCEFVPGWNANNRGEKTLPVTRGGLILTECARGQLGPVRDCGFTEGAGALSAVACPAGGSIELRCSLPDGAAPAVLRACEYSVVLGTGTACVERDALLNTSLLPGETELALACPDGRDESEPGGTVALYAAPLLPGDALELDCAVKE